MSDAELNIVTGAYGFTGRYIARRLIDQGQKVKTLTGHPERECPFGGEVSVAPYLFDEPRALAAELEGATTLYNTYWIRMERGTMTFDRAVVNTEILMRSARKAGVRRIVHISIVNADENSPFPYFRAKWQAEQVIRNSGLEHTVLRPTILFGRESLLFNNLAWLMRKMPTFAIPGKGDYRLQPLHVNDLAEMAVDAGLRSENDVRDAAGPEIFTFEELIRLMTREIHPRIRIMHIQPERALHMSKWLGGMVKDVPLTRDEMGGLMQSLLVSGSPPEGRTRFSDWLRENATGLGAKYRSEVRHHFR